MFGSAAFFLRQDTQEGLEQRRYSLSEKGRSPTNDPQPGGSDATDRCGEHSLSSHPADGALCHRSTSGRTDTPESYRHRQPAYGDSRTRRQGTQRSRRDAQRQATRRIAPALAAVAEKTERLALSRSEKSLR